LHVQSISYWAAANIGPYAQATTIDHSQVYIAGQIALVPHSMNLEPAIGHQIQTSLHNLRAITKHETCEPVGCICYLIKKEDMELAKESWKQKGILLCVGVPRLPRDALVEWQAFGYKMNESRLKTWSEGKEVLTKFSFESFHSFDS
jgi:diphthine-ammonia ligase